MFNHILNVIIKLDLSQIKEISPNGIIIMVCIDKKQVVVNLKSHKTKRKIFSFKIIFEIKKSFLYLWQEIKNENNFNKYLVVEQSRLTVVIEATLLFI
jgi:hypothetical protein